MLKFVFFLWPVLGGLAQADETWVPPQAMEDDWSGALSAAMPGHAVGNCWAINSMAAQAVFAQCKWIAPTGQDVGYVTRSLDGERLCGWGERPEALVDDWVLDLRSGTLTYHSKVSPCPQPVRWDEVCMEGNSC